MDKLFRVVELGDLGLVLMTNMGLIKENRKKSWADIGIYYMSMRDKYSPEELRMLEIDGSPQYLELLNFMKND